MTGKQAHTPGPWFAVHNGLFWDVNVKDDRDAQSIASNHANRMLGMTDDEAAANARLIAAAPALLEALEWLLETSTDPDSAHQGRAIDNARAALLKARPTPSETE